MLRLTLIFFRKCYALIFSYLPLVKEFKIYRLAVGAFPLIIAITPIMALIDVDITVMGNVYRITYVMGKINSSILIVYLCEQRACVLVFMLPFQGGRSYPPWFVSSSKVKVLCSSSMLRACHFVQ